MKNKISIGLIFSLIFSFYSFYIYGNTIHSLIQCDRNFLGLRVLEDRVKCSQLRGICRIASSCSNSKINSPCKIIDYDGKTRNGKVIKTDNITKEKTCRLSE